MSKLDAGMGVDQANLKPVGEMIAYKQCQVVYRQLAIFYNTVENKKDTIDTAQHHTKATQAQNDEQRAAIQQK